MVGFVLLLDVSHVDLAPRHHESDQVAIVRSQTLHALVQSLGEKRVFVFDGMHNRQESFLDVTRKLALDRLFEIVAADTFVLLKDQSKLGVVALAEDHVEDGLVGAPDFLSGVVEGLGVSSRFLLIRDHAFVACHHQASEVAAGVPFQVAFKVLTLRICAANAESASGVKSKLKGYFKFWRESIPLILLNMNNVIIFWLVSRIACFEIVLQV
jgi:hypothetical protein